MIEKHASALPNEALRQASCFWAMNELRINHCKGKELHTFWNIFVSRDDIKRLCADLGQMRTVFR